VQELPGLFGDRLHDLRVRVPGGIHGDAGGAVEEDVAVDVLDRCASSPFDHQRIPTRVRWGNEGFVAIDEGFGLGAGQRGFDIGDGHEHARQKFEVRSQNDFRRLTSDLSLSFPPGSARTVFEKHTACRQVMANAIRRGKVAAAPGGQAFLDQPLDLVDGNRRPFVFGAAQAQHTKYAIEVLERRPHRRGVVFSDMSGVDREVDRADELEHRSERCRRVEVVLHRIAELLSRFIDTRSDLGVPTAG
jgi:hypothetical protein